MSCLYIYSQPGQYDSPRPEFSPLGQAPAPASAQIEKLQSQVDQLTKSQENLQAQLSMQEVHLQAIIRLLQTSQSPRARHIELATESPPFSRIVIPRATNAATQIQ